MNANFDIPTLNWFESNPWAKVGNKYTGSVGATSISNNAFLFTINFYRKDEGNQLVADVYDSISKLENPDEFVTKTFGGSEQGRNDMITQVKNIQYTLDAVHVARMSGCKVFIGTGSQAEYGRVDTALKPDTPCFPENGYGMAKLCAGQMSRVECEKMGIGFLGRNDIFHCIRNRRIHRWWNTGCFFIQFIKTERIRIFSRVI